MLERTAAHAHSTCLSRICDPRDLSVESLLAGLLITWTLDNCRRCQMPAKSEKQRKFMGAELARKRAGKKTQTGMSEKKLEEFASKGGSKKKS